MLLDDQTRETIQEILDARGMSQLDLANTVGVSPGTVTRWLAGDVKKVRRRYAESLGEFLRKGVIEKARHAQAQLTGNIIDSSGKPLKDLSAEWGVPVSSLKNAAQGDPDSIASVTRGRNAALAKRAGVSVEDYNRFLNDIAGVFLEWAKDGTLPKIVDLAETAGIPVDEFLMTTALRKLERSESEEGKDKK